MEYGGYRSLAIRESLSVSFPCVICIFFHSVNFFLCRARSVVERKQWQEQEKSFAGSKP
jgi:hypothetical protein